MDEYKQELAETQAGQLNNETSPEEALEATNGIPNSVLTEIFAGRRKADSNMMGHRVNLAESINAKMTQAFGMDVSQLRVYRSHVMSGTDMKGISQGDTVVLSEDVDLNTAEGQAVLGHELSHIHAQAQGIGTGHSGLYKNAALEHQADVEGMRAARGRPIYEKPMTGNPGLKYGLGMKGVEGITPISRNGIPASAGAPMQAKKEDPDKSELPKFDPKTDIVTDNTPNKKVDTQIKKNPLPNDLKGKTSPDFNLKNPKDKKVLNKILTKDVRDPIAESEVSGTLQKEEADKKELYSFQTKNQRKRNAPEELQSDNEDEVLRKITNDMDANTTFNIGNTFDIPGTFSISKSNELSGGENFSPDFDEFKKGLNDQNLAPLPENPDFDLEEPDNIPVPKEQNKPDNIPVPKEQNKPDLAPKKPESEEFNYIEYKQKQEKLEKKRVKEEQEKKEQQQRELFEKNSGNKTFDKAFDMYFVLGGSIDQKVGDLGWDVAEKLRFGLDDIYHSKISGQSDPEMWEQGIAEMNELVRPYEKILYKKDEEDSPKQPVPQQKSGQNENLIIDSPKEDPLHPTGKALDNQKLTMLTIEYSNDFTQIAQSHPDWDKNNNLSQPFQAYFDAIQSFMQKRKESDDLQKELEKVEAAKKKAHAVLQQQQEQPAIVEQQEQPAVAEQKESGQQEQPAGSQQHEQQNGEHPAAVPEKEEPDNGVAPDLKEVAPIAWRRPTSGNGEAEQPKLGVHIKQDQTGKASESKDLFKVNSHAFLSLEYSKKSRIRNGYQRFRSTFGFYPAVKYQPIGLVAQGGTTSGKLQDDSDVGEDISRSYPISFRQLNTIARAASTYANGGYNLYSRNCTTFAADMVHKAGVDTGNIFQEENWDLGKVKKFGYNVARKVGSLFSTDKDPGHLAENVGKDDLRYGVNRKLTTQEEIERFYRTRRKGGVEAYGYAPSATGERMRRSDKGGLEGNYDFEHADVKEIPTLLSKKELTQLWTKAVAEQAAQSSSKVEQGVQADMQTIINLADELQTAFNTLAQPKVKREIKRRSCEEYFNRTMMTYYLLQNWYDNYARKYPILGQFASELYGKAKYIDREMMDSYPVGFDGPKGDTEVDHALRHIVGDNEKLVRKYAKTLAFGNTPEGKKKIRQLEELDSKSAEGKQIKKNGELYEELLTRKSNEKYFRNMIYDMVDDRFDRYAANGGVQQDDLNELFIDLPDTEIPQAEKMTKTLVSGINFEDGHFSSFSDAMQSGALRMLFGEKPVQDLTKMGNELGAWKRNTNNVNSKNGPVVNSVNNLTQTLVDTQRDKVKMVMRSLSLSKDFAKFSPYQLALKTMNVIESLYTVPLLSERIKVTKEDYQNKLSDLVGTKQQQASMMNRMSEEDYTQALAEGQNTLPPAGLISALKEMAQEVKAEPANKKLQDPDLLRKTEEQVKNSMELIKKQKAPDGNPEAADDKTMHDELFSTLLQINLNVKKDAEGDGDDDNDEFDE